MRLVDIAGRPFDDDAGNAAQLRGKRQVAAPAAASIPVRCSITMTSPGLRGLDRRRPKMPRRRRPAIVRARASRSRRARRSRRSVATRWMPVATPLQPELVERVGHRARVEPANRPIRSSKQDTPDAFHLNP